MGILEELKQLMQLGVVDDIAVLAETDIRNKDNIVKRKSLYAQLQSTIANLEEQVKNSNGTIETLERQLVQYGINNKILRGGVEVDKQTQASKANIMKDELESRAKQKYYRNVLENDVKNVRDNIKKSNK